MKSIFKFAAVVAIASLAFVACKNNQPAEEEIDSTAIEQIVEDEIACDAVEVADTVVVEEETPAQTVKKPTTQKPAAPTATKATKAETKTTENATIQDAPAAVKGANGEAKKTTSVKRK